MVNNKSRPAHWAAAAVAVILALLAAGLGIWQLGRAQQKQSIIELRTARQQALSLGGELRWQANVQPATLDQQRVALSGRWLYEASVALDNRAWEGRAGVHVLTPMALADGSMVWVNRGWMAKPPGALLPDMPQPPEQRASIEGVALASVMRRMELSSDPDSLRQGNLWQNFDWAAAAERASGNVWPVVVWQTSDSADGLMRKIPEVKSDVPKHLGYALQWFLLAVAALYFAWRLRPHQHA